MRRRRDLVAPQLRRIERRRVEQERLRKAGILEHLAAHDCQRKMKPGRLLSLIGCSVVLLAVCTPQQSSAKLASRAAADARPALAALHYRVEVLRTPWALQRVSRDGAVIWIWTIENGCDPILPNRFLHAEVREVAGGLRVIAFNVAYFPVKTRYACRLPLFRHRHRVELPHPLGGDKILGECVPRDPREACALLHAVADTRKGEPGQDPWLG
jgi:hypothetical protein